MEDSMKYLINKDGKKCSIEQLQRDIKRDVTGIYKAFRRSKRITQSELATITGIAQPNITRFESDDSNPTLELMVKMAAAMGMRVTIGFEPLENNKE